MRKTIRSISLISSMKVSAVISTLLFVIFGGIALLMQILFGSVIGASMGGSEGLGMFGASTGIAIIVYLFGILAYAVIGAIAGLINALIYNIVAGMVGGIEIDLE